MDSWFSDFDVYLLAEGRHFRSYDRFGAHPIEVDGQKGVYFAVWAPNAREVSVVGDFNHWNAHANRLFCRVELGVWEGFIPNVRPGSCYKYSIVSNVNNYTVEKCDPYGFYFEVPPRSASVVWDIGGYEWNDSTWLAERGSRNSLRAPMSIYEVHLGSWMYNLHNEPRPLSYLELAEKLPAYVQDMGYTHVEFLPITEHPFDASWGYQTLGYFAPTSRFGTPQDFMVLVDALHQHGVGVILDWVPAHFPTDGHGLSFFDGTHLYEHQDPRKGFHPDWGTLIFNYGRTEVANFLISSAMFWLEKYHIDGLRLDAVASMIYLDYSRDEGEWIPNPHGGRENIEAIEFLKQLNSVVYSKFPDVVTIAEESTAWPMVSRPTYVGGLGFGLKWNMGWMNDVLTYITKDPVHRKYHHNSLTFGLLYAFHENFVLPFSHDEVVHGKGAMLSKMPGDDWQKFANLRLVLGYMYGHPGKKLLFMGADFGQWAEWSHDVSLDWHLLQYPAHQGIQHWVRDLNRLHREAGALHQVDFEPHGFHWVDCHDAMQSVLSFVRCGERHEEQVLCIYNFTPVPRYHYRVGVDFGGYWEELLNSDANIYAGSGMGNAGGVLADDISAHGRPHSLNLILPPLSALFFRWVPGHGA